MRMSVSEVLGAIGERSTRGASKPLLVAEALERALVDGRLPLGVQLPGERPLANALGVSRVTLVEALGRLRAQGWIVTRHGSGTTTTLPKNYTIRTEPASLRSPKGMLNLAQAMPAAPLHAVLQAMRSIDYDLRRELVDTGYHAGGVAALRARIAGLLTTDDVPAAAEEVLITSGAMDALAVSLRLVGAAARRQCVVVEAPTYPGALSVLHHAARPIPWPTPDDATTLGLLFARHRPDAMFLVPDGHNPTGAIRPPEWRTEVAREARRHGVRLIVDHTLRPLDLRGAPCLEPPMTATESHALVVGSFAKIVWSGLRVGWLRASAAEVGYLTDLGVGGASVVDQLLLLQLLDDHDRYVAQRRDHLAATRDAFVAALPTDQFELDGAPAGGIAIWLRLTSCSATMLARAAAAGGITIAPGPTFHADQRGDGHIRLPLTLDAQNVADTITRLNDLAQQVCYERQMDNRT